MFHRILIPVENTVTDEAILQYIRPIARECRATLVLIHVADGWAARNIGALALRESEEMKADRAYLDRVSATLRGEGFEAEGLLAAGDPAKEIAEAALREKCDLIAMATHGHKGLEDVVRGSVATKLRHITSIPILMVRAASR